MLPNEACGDSNVLYLLLSNMAASNFMWLWAFEMLLVASILDRGFPEQEAPSRTYMNEVFREAVLTLSKTESKLIWRKQKINP
jgi:hypothetical protein